MPGLASHKVLRVAVIVDGESCEELHQTEPGDVVIGRAAEPGLGVGPSTPLEYGAAAGSEDAHRGAWALIVIGILLLVGAGGWFGYDVQQHVVANAVLGEKVGGEVVDEVASLAYAASVEERAIARGKKVGRLLANKTDYTSTIALSLALLSVVPIVGGVTMLRGRRRRRNDRRILRVYDGYARSPDYRKRAPVWLALGLVMAVGGGGLFAYEVGSRDAGEILNEDATRGDISAFKQADREGTGGIGLILALAGLVPLVVGAMGMREAPQKPRSRKPKGSQVPRQHTLFEWVESEGTYYVNFPPETKGKVALGKNKASVKALRKRFSQPDGDLRVKLGSSAKGKLLIGQTKIIFRTGKPARPAAVPVFPPQLADPLAHLRVSGLDAAAFAAAAGVAALVGVWFWMFADRSDRGPDERFVEVMELPAALYEEEPEEPEEEEEEQEETLKLEDKDEAKDEEVPEDKLEKPKNVSEKAFEEARGVGVARVLGTYGGPGEGTVLDVIESTENNLGSLFAQGMTTTDEYRGGEIGEFVAGGGGIDATGNVASNEALQTGEGPAEVGKTDKKERKVKGKAKSSTGDVFGDVDKKAVSATIRRKMPGLQACYEKALRSNQGLKGKMSYTITINPQGRVTKVVIEADTLSDSSVRTCTTGKIKGWRFFTEGAEESSEVTFSVSFTGA